jgi:hypothetical protein
MAPQSGPPLDFAALCDQAVLRCLAAGNMTWIDNAFGPASYPTHEEAVHALRHLVVRHLLKEAGDATGAALILDGLHKLEVPESGDERFFRLLCGYAARELEATKPLVRPRGALRNFASVVVWGDAYIERFETYCLASLAAPGNLPFLHRNGRVTLMVHTTAKDAPRIRRLPILRRLGIGVRTWAIPDELLQAAEGDLKYWMLGALQSVHLFYAAQRRANFLPIFPDGFYADRYCESILQAGNDVDAVFWGSFKAYRSGLMPMMDSHLKDGVYSVPANTLVELSLQHLHVHIINCFIDLTLQSLPEHRMLWAHCGDYLEVHSPHYNAALIRNDVISSIRPRYLMTLDSELEKLLPPGRRIHFRSVEDGYFGTELVDEPTPPLRHFSYQDYARFFIQHANASHLRFQQRPFRIGIRPEWLTAVESFSPQAVTACFERIERLIEEELRKAARFDRTDLILNILERLAGTALTGEERRLVTQAREAVAKMAAQPPASAA